MRENPKFGYLGDVSAESIYKEVDGGLYLISRIWLGRTMHPILRRFIINDKMAKSMAEHCAVEYRNLAEILPALYAER